MPGRKRRGQPTRGKMGRIDEFPEEIRAALIELLRARIPQTRILQKLAPLLEEAGIEPLSPATLSRYATKMEGVGRRILETRAIADSLATRFGKDPESQIGKHMVEVLRVMAFDVAMILANRQRDPEDPEQLSLELDSINKLALALERLEKTAASGAKTEREIRKEQAEKAYSAAKKEGLPDNIADAIRAALTGGDAAYAPA